MRLVKLSLLSVFAAMLLSACGESAIENEGSSESAVTVYDGWPSDLLDEMMKEDLGSDLTLPVPSEALDAGRTYVVSYYYNDVSLYGEITIEASGDFASYADELKGEENGWLEPARIVYSDCRFFNAPDLSLYLVFYDYDPDADSTKFRVSNYQTSYYAVWPEKLIAQAMDEVVGEGHTPLPSIEGTLYQFAAFIDDHIFDYDLVWVEVYDVSEEDYVDVLLSAGFTEEAGSKWYVDPLSEYRIVLEFNVSWNSLSIEAAALDGESD